MQAFHPQPLNPDAAHTALPLQIKRHGNQPPKKKSKVSKKAHQPDFVTVPDMSRILADIKQLGLGLVGDVRLRLCPEP